MFDASAMIMADKATKRHVLSARPDAQTTPERPPRQRGESMRQLAATALRRLADRVEPRTVKPCVPTP